MKYLITGGLGHIGSKLIRQLASNLEAEVTVVDDLRTQRYSSIFNLPRRNSLKLCTTNILELDKVFFEENKFDVIVHLAATTDAAGTANNPQLIFENNLAITRKLTMFAESNKIPLIFISSTSVYGSQENVVDESTSYLNPQSPYAECKLQEENVLLASNLPNYVILRFGTIFGFSEGMRFHTAVNKFCWQASNGLPITVWETAMNQLRPYLGIEDAITAIIFFAKCMLDETPLKEVFNIVTTNCSVNEILEAIRKTSGKELLIDFVSSPIMNQLSFSVSAEKAKRLGFIPKDDIEFEIDKVMKSLAGLKQ